MRIEITRPNGDLKREVWSFSLSTSYVSPCIYLDDYSFQTRESKRRIWKKQTHWTRLVRRGNNIDCPPLPQDIEAEMRSRYQEYIMALPITN